MKKWVLNKSDEFPQIEGIHPNITALLGIRGVTGEEDVKEFLSDSPKRTYDPFLMKGIRSAVEKIKEHIERDSKICIYGDYDVDGVTAICLVFEFLRNLTDNLMWYVPVRHNEGYGINKGALEKIKNRGADLVISVDCGISSYDEVEYAKKLGMDIIITDHHTVGERIPDSIVINPKQPECPYPFKELCGCGVAYKLIQALQRTFNLDKNTIRKGLDLVATATVADIVPLLGENRTLIKYGLREINHRRRPGLRMLISAVGLSDKSITASDIAFVIGPHINAGGRINSAESGIKLLLADNENDAEKLSERLVENNNLRKTLQMQGFENAKKALKKETINNVILVHDCDIHEGVAGIVAGKLKEEYNRPALIVTDNEEIGALKGTGRSIDSINLYELLKTQEKLLLGYGGHKAACGFSIAYTNLGKFKLGLESEIEIMKNNNPELMDEVLNIDGILRIEDADNAFGWMLESMEPFGQSNPRPVFLIEKVYIEFLKFVGREKEHCRFSVRDMKGNRLECIMFNGESLFRGISTEGKLFDFAGRINMNYRGGEYNIQFIPVDFRRSK